MTKHCPVCAEPVVPACGPQDADILIITPPVEEEEIKVNRPLVGMDKQILRSEFMKYDIDLITFRIVSLMFHPIGEDERCIQAGLDYVLDEAKDRKAILLIGSDVTKVFTEYGSQEICGLEMESALLSAPLIMGIITPKSAFTRGHGEIKLAIKKFVSALKREGVIE